MRSDVIWRAVLPVSAAVSLAVGAPQPVTGGLALAGLVLTAERLTRLRRAGVADQVLLGVGGILVALVLTGTLLGSTGWGLSPTTWAIAVVVVSLLGLLVAGVLRPRRAPSRASAHGSDDAGRVHRGQALRLAPWVLLSAVLVVGLVRVSTDSLAAANEPPVQMSFGRVDGTQVQVVVRSSDAVGPLEVRTSAEGTDISYPLFDVPDDGSVTTTLSLPREGRFVVTLNRPDQSSPLRTLILDR